MQVVLPWQHIGHGSHSLPIRAIRFFLSPIFCKIPNRTPFFDFEQKSVSCHHINIKEKYSKTMRDVHISICTHVGTTQREELTRKGMPAYPTWMRLLKVQTIVLVTQIVCCCWRCNFSKWQNTTHEVEEVICLFLPLHRILLEAEKRMQSSNNTGNQDYQVMGCQTLGRMSGTTTQTGLDWPISGWHILWNGWNRTAGSDRKSLGHPGVSLGSWQAVWGFCWWNKDEI